MVILIIKVNRNMYSFVNKIKTYSNNHKLSYRCTVLVKAKKLKGRKKKFGDKKQLNGIFQKDFKNIFTKFNILVKYRIPIIFERI